MKTKLHSHSNIAVLLIAILIIGGQLSAQSIEDAPNHLKQLDGPVYHTAAELGLRAAPADWEGRRPDRVVLQYIEHKVYRWNEYDVENEDGTKSYFIVVEQPFEKALSVEEAETLANASVSWQYIKVKSESVEVLPADDPSLQVPEAKMPIVDPSVETVFEEGTDPNAEVSFTVSDEASGSTSGGKRADNSGRSVIGNDDRIKLSESEAQLLPFQTICYTDQQFPNAGSFRGTAFLVTPYVALTNGHIVYDRDFGEFASSITIYPGQSENSSGFVVRPYGSRSAAVYNTFQGYVDTGSSSFDCASIQFNSAFSGLSTFMPIVADLNVASVNNAGFPGQAQGSPTFAMWRAFNSVTGLSDSTRTIGHLADTSGGNSGGPLWFFDGANRQVTGIHCCGGVSENFGFYIRNDGSLNTINDWMAYQPAGGGPANDLFSNAITISGTSGSTTGSNAGATAGEAGEPNHANRTTPTYDSSVWWKWTPSTSGDATINTNGSSFDTVLAAYTGTSVAGLTEVASDDDGGIGNQSQITFSASAGVTYHIAVAGFNNATGNINLAWELTPVVVQDDQFEDNDVYTNPTSLPMNQLVSDLVLLDDDWYRLSFGSEQHLDIELNFLHSAGNINCQIYDRRGARAGEIFSVDVGASYSLSDNERITYVNQLGATELLLRVYGEGGATNNSYSIRTTIYNDDDSSEMNNDLSCGTMPTIQPNQTYSNLIIRDDDWYRVNVAGLSTLSVTLDHEYFSGDLDIMITRDTGDCEAYNQTLALGNVHDPNITEQVTANVSGLNTVLLRIYGEQRQRNFYNLILTGN
jgi:V8-like Glu-specific endopeptidase